jgi:hypothetical protein
VVFDVPAQFASEEIYFQAYESIPTPMTSNLVVSNMLPRLVTSIVPAGNPISNAQTVVFNVEFRESVLGVSSEDFILETDRVTGARIEGVEGRGSSYRVVVNTGVGDGTITLVLKDESRIADATGFDPSLTRFGSFKGDPIRVHKMLLDANLDYSVSPLDVLVVIDTLNRSGASLPVGPDSPIHAYDVNLDGWVTPLDALAVIDYLNTNSTKGGEGAGEGEGIFDTRNVDQAAPFVVLEPANFNRIVEVRDLTSLLEGPMQQTVSYDVVGKLLHDNSTRIAPPKKSELEDIWEGEWDFASESIDELIDQILGKDDTQ